MSSHYTLVDVKERIYQYQLALEAAVIELTLWAEAQAAADAGEKIPGALDTSAEKPGLINQGLARLRGQKVKNYASCLSPSTNFTDDE